MTDDTDKSQQGAAIKPAIGVSTRKGTSPSKSVNEDAFLIAPMAGGQMWLLAIADGVTNSSNSWWASNKCVELIWRTLPNYEHQFLDPDTSESKKKIMEQWLNDIHNSFLKERQKDLADFKGATSTLTFAVAGEGKFFWGHCGDSRLYKLSPSGKLLSAFSVGDQKSKSKESRGVLLNHIAAPPKEWKTKFIVGGDSIPADGMLVLCSDGVISGNEDLQKTNLILTLREFKDNLQKRVDEITEQIADLGETDDLTLIAFKPGDN